MQQGLLLLIIFIISNYKIANLAKSNIAMIVYSFNKLRIIFKVHSQFNHVPLLPIMWILKISILVHFLSMFGLRLQP